jgi:chorismate-pyruvate lyase
MIMNGIEADINALDEIVKIKGLSGIEKILLATDGTVTTILDVLNGKTSVKILGRETKKADKALSELLGIYEGEEVSCRIVLMHKNELPLIYAESLIPLKMPDENLKTDLLFSDMPIGRILRKHNIESRREIVGVSAAHGGDMLKGLFKSGGEFLSREYRIISGGKTLVWIKEMFPSDYFK